MIWKHATDRHQWRTSRSSTTSKFWLTSGMNVFQWGENWWTVTGRQRKWELQGGIWEISYGNPPVNRLLFHGGRPSQRDITMTWRKQMCPLQSVNPALAWPWPWPPPLLCAVIEVMIVPQPKTPSRSCHEGIGNKQRGAEWISSGSDLEKTKRKTTTFRCQHSKSESLSVQELTRYGVRVSRL